MDSRRKIWRGVLAHLAARKTPTFTAGDVASELDDVWENPGGDGGSAYAGAAQLLRRLQTWGHVRVIGFEPSESGLGRRRKLYEVTDHGRKCAKYYKRQAVKK
jgi:hypothetical protein